MFNAKLPFVLKHRWNERSPLVSALLLLRHEDKTLLGPNSFRSARLGPGLLGLDKIGEDWSWQKEQDCKGYSSETSTMRCASKVLHGHW